MTKNLCERTSNGVTVSLDWNPETDEVIVRYSDSKTGLRYTLDPPKFLALDAYRHPNAYFKGAVNGVYNPRGLNPESLA